MPDVASAPLLPPVQGAVGDQPRPDSRACLDVNDILFAAGQSSPQLTQGHDVDLVVHPYRYAEPLCEALTHRVAVPARHDRGRHGNAGRELDRPRESQSNPPGRGRRVGVTDKQAVEELLDASQAGARTVGDLHGFAGLQEDVACEVRDPDGHAARAHLRDEDAAPRRVEPDLPGCSAARRGGDSPVLEEASLHQLSDALGHHSPAQTRAMREGGAGQRPELADLVQHGDQAVVMAPRSVHTSRRSGVPCHVRSFRVQPVLRTG
ncbi:hypothetical protein NOCA2360034 [metagenome]|uniref:Uncharacterized protein n=1 Tax=metagenome TaxID=256318 RepID=A0A2P2C438_9ZZZZ